MIPGPLTAPEPFTPAAATRRANLLLRAQESRRDVDFEQALRSKRVPVNDPASPTGRAEIPTNVPELSEDPSRATDDPSHEESSGEVRRGDDRAGASPGGSDEASSAQVDDAAAARSGEDSAAGRGGDAAPDLASAGAAAAPTAQSVDRPMTIHTLNARLLTDAPRDPRHDPARIWRESGFDSTRTSSTPAPASVPGSTAPTGPRPDSGVVAGAEVRPQAEGSLGTPSMASDRPWSVGQRHDAHATGSPVVGADEPAPPAPANPGSPMQALSTTASVPVIAVATRSADAGGGKGAAGTAGGRGGRGGRGRWRPRGRRTWQPRSMSALQPDRPSGSHPAPAVKPLHRR